MDNTQQSATASHSTPEKAKDAPSLWKKLGEHWRRVEAFYLTRLTKSHCGRNLADEAPPALARQSCMTCV